jgi:SAM-dependent methyltransferase
MVDSKIAYEAAPTALKKWYWEKRKHLSEAPQKVLQSFFSWADKKGYMSGAEQSPYSFMFSSRQLKFLLDSLDETKSIDGCVLEVGCAHGATTIFLYEYLRDSGVSKPYYCIDTFSGFTDSDIEYENRNRGKQYNYTSAFKNNSVERFKRNLRQRKIDDVHVIQADINRFDITTIPPISFCLLDVDLYQPVLAGLEKILPHVNAGGTIVIDDCWVDDEHFYKSIPDMYDGALEAYREFVSKNQLPVTLVEKKLGVIRKI